MHRAPLPDRHLWPTRQGLAGQEQVAGTLPPVFVVLPQRKSRSGRQSGPGLCQQLGGCLVKADHRTLGIIGFVVEIQDILHVGHKFRTYLGNAPLLLPPRLEFVFFSTWLTVSLEIESVNSSFTASSASNYNVQRECPSGAALPHPADRGGTYHQSFRHLLVGKAFIGFTQNQRPLHFRSRGLAPPRDTQQMFPLFLGRAHSI